MKTAQLIKKIKKTIESFGDRWTIILAIVIVLTLIGLLNLLSISLHSNQPLFQTPFGRQLIWAIVGGLIATIIFYLPLRSIYASAYFLYFLGIGLLILPSLIGPSVAGAKRWLFIGPIGLQPSEFMKPLVVIAIAHYLASTKSNILDFKTLIIPILFSLIPTLIVLNQPDLGTAIIYFGVLIPLLYWAGARLFHIFIIIAPVVSLIMAFSFYAYFIWIIIVIAILYFTREKLWISILIFSLTIIIGSSASIAWKSLKPYQQKRILTLLNIDADPRGSGYQVIQSKIAIGSGGWFGKGFSKGTQTQLKFLPKGHTDFIFSVVGEELGFLGSSIVILLFFTLIFISVSIGFRLKDRFSSLVLIGCASILFFHVIINVAMTMGLMPVTGLPLPFFSYGGSFLITCFILTGIILNIASLRH